MIDMKIRRNALGQRLKTRFLGEYHMITDKLQKASREKVILNDNRVVIGSHLSIFLSFINSFSF